MAYLNDIVSDAAGSLWSGKSYVYTGRRERKAQRAVAVLRRRDVVLDVSYPHPVEELFDIRAKSARHGGAINPARSPPVDVRRSLGLRRREGLPCRSAAVGGGRVVKRRHTVMAQANDKRAETPVSFICPVRRCSRAGVRCRRNASTNIVKPDSLSCASKTSKACATARRKVVHRQAQPSAASWNLEGANSAFLPQR